MRTLALPASPPSVRLARDWVTAVLVEIGRAELAESARLAVSELVTNAILHAEPPMTVHVRGTVAHPRIEVADRSLLPPKQSEHAPSRLEDDFSWTTVGRGLDLVACYAHAWGADIDPHGHGKVVWFEPAAEPRETPTPGELFNLDEAISAREEPGHQDEEMLDLYLLGMPVELFGHLRVHFNELGRELRLLAISDPDRYPIAVEFAEVYLQIEHERRTAGGLEVLDRAMVDGVDTVDLHYRIPPTAPASMTRMASLLQTVYQSFGEESLLVVRPPAELEDLQRWYLGEFGRQAQGLAPIPWTGPTSLGQQEVS